MNILNKIIIIFILLSIPTFLFSRYTETRLEKGLTSNLIIDDFSTYTNEKIKTIDTFRKLKFDTKRYYFGARYYDPKLSRWTAADPPIARGDYLPKPGDFDTEHNYFYYSAHDSSAKLKGHGGVFNPINLNAYQYAGQNPVKFVDPDGEAPINANRDNVARLFDDGGGSGGGGVGGNPFLAPADMPGGIVAGGGIFGFGGFGGGFRGSPKISSQNNPSAIKGMLSKISNNIKDFFKSKTLFRLYGGDSKQLGKSWTTKNPIKMKDPRNQLGLPNSNTADRIVKGKLIDYEGVSGRKALPYDGNKGGEMEIIVPKPSEQIKILSDKPFKK